MSSEIRDRVKEKIGFRLYQAGIANTRKRMEVSSQILSIPEIAIVDREAKLPNYIGAAIAGTLKDWIKEIKDD